MSFQIIRSDITKVKADAIVNTANPNVAVGGGVDFAIYKAAGRDKLLEARKNIGTLKPGEVAVTKAFDLNAKYIIHVSSPWWQGGSKNEDESLRLCYQRALQLAKRHRCKSIAFPVLATGTYGFPKELGIQIAVDTFTDFLEENDIEITLVVFGSEDVSISGKLVEEVASYIDDSYVENAIAKEYQDDIGSCERGNRSRRREEAIFQSMPLPSYCEEEKGDEIKSIHDDFNEESESESLEDALKKIYTDSFEKHLQQLINKKGLKNSQVYAAANISKQYFSKLLKGKVKPSKEKMLALAVGLRLNLDETVDFLRIAGYALSPISQTDKIVEYFIQHKDYNVLKIDIVLFDYGLDTLSNQ